MELDILAHENTRKMRTMAVPRWVLLENIVVGGVSLVAFLGYAQVVAGTELD
jgi:hypothetical protein